MSGGGVCLQPLGKRSIDRTERPRPRPRHDSPHTTLTLRPPRVRARNQRRLALLTLGMRHPIGNSALRTQPVVPPSQPDAKSWEGCAGEIRAARR